MKISFLIKTLLFVFFIFPLSLSAQTTLPDELNPISLGHRFTYYSELLNEERTVNIYLPEYYEESSPEHKYPVIFLNDEHGDRFFQATAGLVRHLSYVERIPESIVVSFHNSESYAPTVYNNGMWGDRETLEFGKDPDLFIEHLEKEFFPMLQEKFRAADFNIIVGVSGSGVFPLHAFAKGNHLFDAYFIHACADVIGMGYESGKTFVDAFEQSFNQIPNQKTRLYFSVADGDLNWQEEYKENLKDLEQRLEPFVSDEFKMKIDVISNEGHYDSYLKALLAGFEFVFPKEKWSPKYRDIADKQGNAMANIDSFYQNLSDEYGFQILPKANRWNNVNCLRFIGSRYLIEERTAEAIEVLQRWVAYRPQSVEALSQLANGYQINQQNQLAISTQQKAVELASKFDPDNLKYYQDQLNEFLESNKKND